MVVRSLATHQRYKLVTGTFYARIARDKWLGASNCTVYLYPCLWPLLSLCIHSHHQAKDLLVSTNLLLLISFDTCPQPPPPLHLPHSPPPTPPFKYLCFCVCSFVYLFGFCLHVCLFLYVFLSFFHFSFSHLLID